MKKISFWASSHILAARSLIVVIHFALVALSVYIGLLLQQVNVIIPALPFYLISTVLLIITLGIYPFIKTAYFKQKACDIMLPLSACLVIVAGINNADNVPSASLAYGNNIIHLPTAENSLTSAKTKHSISPKEKRKLKRTFFKQVKVYVATKKNNDPAKATEAKKTILIILSVIVMLGLTALLGVLVCSIACNSGWVAAVAVGVFGLAGIIWSFIAILKRIKRGPKQPGAVKEE